MWLSCPSWDHVHSVLWWAIPCTVCARNPAKDATLRNNAKRPLLALDLVHVSKRLWRGFSWLAVREVSGLAKAIPSTGHAVISISMFVNPHRITLYLGTQ